MGTVKVGRGAAVGLRPEVGILGSNARSNVKSLIFPWHLAPCKVFTACESVFALAPVHFAVTAENAAVGDFSREAAK